MSKEPLEQNTAGAEPIEPTAADVEKIAMLPLHLLVPLSFIAQRETGIKGSNSSYNKVTYINVWGLISKLINPEELGVIDALFSDIKARLEEAKPIPTADESANIPPEEQDIVLALNWAAEHKEELLRTIDRAAGVCKFFFFLHDEIKKDEYGGKTLTELEQESIDDDNQVAQGSLFERAIAVANAKLKDELPAGTDLQLQYQSIVTYQSKPTVDVTIDKLTTVFFGQGHRHQPRTQKGIDGQLTFATPYSVKYEKNGAPEISLYFNYMYDKDTMARLGLPEEIDSEDMFILSVIGNEYLLRNYRNSATRLYKELHGEDPNGTQLTEFYKKLVKLSTTTVYINDKAVKEAWLKNDSKATYREIYDRLAPIRIGGERYVANGKVVEAPINIYAFPAIFEVGHSIGQFTTVPKVILQVKDKNGRAVKRTKRFWRALQYLIKAIAQIKDGTRVNKILYKTYFDELEENTPSKQRLALEVFFKILDHFVNCGWIAGYKEETAQTTGDVGVRILFNEKRQKQIRAAIKKKKQLEQLQ